MKNQIRCIICDELNQGSEEHIIPLSLGNKSLKIYDVCKSCNNRLGDNVDNYLVNHIFIQIIRQRLRLKGESGKIPNPFKEGTDKEGRIIHVDDSFTPHTIPRLLQVDENKLSIEAPTREQAKQMGAKRLKRMGFDKDKIEDFYNQVDIMPMKEFQPDIMYNADVDFNKFFLAALKIAYEYAFFRLGELFYQDETAYEIRNILYDATKGNFQKQYKKINIMPKVLFNILIPMQDQNYHMLIIHKDAADKLITSVSLFMNPAFSYSVCIAENASKYRLNESIMDVIEIETGGLSE